METTKKGKVSLSSDELRILYDVRGKSIREIAIVCKCKKDTVRRAMIAFGIPRRSHTRDSVLSQFGAADLRRRLAESTYQMVADDLAVNKSTLIRYLNRERNIE